MNVRSSLFAGLAALLAGTAARAQGEPNDTCSTAFTLGPGLHGAPFHTEESYGPNLPGGNWVDLDWYRISVQPGQQIRVTVDRTSSGGDPAQLESRLYSGPCPATLLSQVNDDGQLVATNTTAQVVDYRVQSNAYVFNHGFATIEYTLFVQLGFSPGCATGIEDTFEVGPGIRVPMAPGTYAGLYATSLNDDEYTLRLPLGTTIRAQIDFTHAQGDLDLEVRDGSTTLRSDGFTDQEAIVYAAAPPAPFRDVVVRVAPKTGLTSVCNVYALRIDVLQTAFGTSYCQAGVNGHGTEAWILPAGSDSVGANALSFVCQAFPGANPGILIASPNQTQVPFGDGFRCLGAGIVRLGPSSATNGVATYPVDLASGGGLAITPGTTWNFQGFYRDTTLAGGAGFNLTNGVSIPMLP